MATVAGVGSRIYERNSKSVTRNQQKGWTTYTNAAKKADMGQELSPDDDFFLGAAAGVAHAVMGKKSKGHPVLRSRFQSKEASNIVPTKNDLWGDETINDHWEGQYFSRDRQRGEKSRAALAHELQLEKSYASHQVRTPVADFSDAARRSEYIFKNTPRQLERSIKDSTPKPQSRKFGPVSAVPPFMPYDFKESVGPNATSEDIMSGLYNRVNERAENHLGQSFVAAANQKKVSTVFTPMKPRDVKVKERIEVDPVGYKYPSKKKFDDPIWVGDIRDSSIEQHTWNQQSLREDNAMDRGVVVVVDMNTDQPVDDDGCLIVNANDVSNIDSYLKSPAPDRVIDCSLGDTPYTPFNQRGRSKIAKPFRGTHSEKSTQPPVADPGSITISKVPTPSREPSYQRSPKPRRMSYSSKGDFLLDFAMATTTHRPSLVEHTNQPQSREDFLMNFAKRSVALHKYG
eukprot:TRINITY_DN14706_c0_g1_i1.p1 TRINITY_DN14706_c0_g1~~TRINITY_DN14706_c0_g1_i1.p1  ORF type:complete len:458 (+),score=69.65 TRINITY_DN14706_c0_g1_i1:51-1424(+)